MKTDAGKLAESNFSTYAHPLVVQAIEQASSLEGEPDAEKLHKLRVALRRLRTLLWAYRPILDEDFETQQRALFKYLANAAGNTRDWDILIGLVKKHAKQDLLDALTKNRVDASATSRETLSNADLSHVLRGAVSEANRELNTAHARTPLSRFARKRVTAAQRQLEKRMHKAAKARRTDYASLHDVRKAGKKVRYLIEFFEPLLGKKQRKGIKSLKRLQKRLGALNDVVASRALLDKHRSALPGGSGAGRALRSLKKEQKRRMQAAAKLL